MKKILIVIVLSFIFTFPVTINSAELVKETESAYLIEASTGKVLYEYNSDVKRPPASMTKIMTLYLIMRAMDDGMFTLSDTVTASKNASSMGGSQVFLAEGETLSVDDYIKCIAIVSANDCAVAMAERISGTEELFVDLMNETAIEFGLIDTFFKDCTGLTDDGHYSTAKDMAIMGQKLINEYPEVLDYTSRYEDYIRENTNSPHWLVNTNKLVKFETGVDGLKTGVLSHFGSRNK